MKKSRYFVESYLHLHNNRNPEPTKFNFILQLISLSDGHWFQIHIMYKIKNISETKNDQT